jgi:hypothetical protein
VKRRKLRASLIPTLLATAYTIPALSGCGRKQDQAQAPTSAAAPPPTTQAAAALRQEVIQVLRQGATDQVIVNLAGKPGTRFRVVWSETGDADSYALVPKGEGTLGEDGVASVSFALGKLAKAQVHLTVLTSDDAEFATVRELPEPIVLEVEAPAQQMEKGVVEEGFERLRRELQRKTDVRTPSAVAGVRG